MNPACTQCGASLQASDAFCPSCGARQGAPADAPPAPRFCMHCGAQLSGGTAFCTKCGKPVSAPPATAPAPEASAPPPAPPPVQATPPPPAPAAAATPPTMAAAAPTPPPAQPPKSGNLLLKVILGVVGFFVLATVVVIGSCVYLGYRAKKKVDQIQQAYKHNDVAGMVHAIEGGNSAAPAQKLPEWKPAPPDLASSPNAKVPLRVSLRLVVAGNDPLQGDYESIFTFDSVTDQAVHIKASQEYPKPTDLGKLLGQPAGNKQLAQRIKCGRTLLRADLENSAEDPGYVCMGNQENKFPGTTALEISRNTFNQLKTRGEAHYTTHDDPIKAMLKSFKNAATGSGDPTELLNRLIPMPGSPPPQTAAIHCTLRRVGADVAFPVTLNGQQVVLPAIHVVSEHSEDGDKREGFILDDPDNPLSLAGQSQSEGISQVIRISWDTPANQLEQELQQNGRAKVYGIYFDFASDVLRTESKAVLDEIAEVMRKHPDWKLRVEGHTDNIGGDAYNLDLSNRRAAAVKQALVSQYRLDASKFSTAGFGASRPVASNDTMEGRALNRRVELVRE